jgi:hypothetical protein
VTVSPACLTIGPPVLPSISIALNAADSAFPCFETSHTGDHAVETLAVFGSMTVPPIQNVVPRNRPAPFR